jgi:hypothetical protein
MSSSGGLEFVSAMLELCPLQPFHVTNHQREWYCIPSRSTHLWNLNTEIIAVPFIPTYRELEMLKLTILYLAFKSTS